MGRTWERQALIKVRPVAGNMRLGEEFIRSIEPFVYRKYLSVAEINEIKALKRRIEQKTGLAGDTEKEVKTGRGGMLEKGDDGNTDPRNHFVWDIDANTMLAVLTGAVQQLAAGRVEQHGEIVGQLSR